jgi:competence protein ComEC
MPAWSTDHLQENLPAALPGPSRRTPNTKARPVARPLVPVTLAFMAGIAAPAWGLHLPEIALAVGLLLLWSGLAFLWWQGRPARLLPLLFFWLLGVAFCQQAWQPWFPTGHVTRLPQAQHLTLWGHLYRPGKLGQERVQLFLEAEAWRSPWGWRPAAGKILVVAPRLEPPPVGTGLVIRGRLRSPGMLHNPGTFNRPRYLAAEGIFRQMRLFEARRLIFLAATDAQPLGERLRGGIRQQLRSLDPTSRAMYLAMLLGDQGEVTPEMRANFARTGTSHLLAINGLHLGMVAAVTYFLVFWLLRRIPWLLMRVNVIKVATLAAALPVVAYAWVAGGSPSTQRAEVMVLAYLLLVFLGRPKEVWSALALAALVILSLSPLRLFAISFQLSFVAVAALIYLVPRLVRGLATAERPKAGRLAWWLLRVKEWAVVSAVATLATAPLVAAYFQVVSFLGILVNLAAIPLVLMLALPLGEAAVLAQALSLPPVAYGFVFLGKLPLWLGYHLIAWAAQVPGSAMVMPIPTWLEIGLYYLIFILLFAPRRTYLTWAGTGLAGLALATAAVWPLVTVPRALEVTCLDAFNGLRAVVVSPENRRLVVSAVASAWPGRPAPTWGPLPGYCHWRQFQRLDLVTALNLSEDNAGELQTLVEQFKVGSCWCGRWGRQGPATWDLWNYLGDRGALPRSLERRPPPMSLGSLSLKFLKLGPEAGVALEVTYQDRRVMFIPPVTALTAADLPAGVGPLELLVFPADLATPRGRNLIMGCLKPRRVVIYGDGGRSGAARITWPVVCQFTRKGAVSLYLAASGATMRQWRPSYGLPVPASSSRSVQVNSPGSLSRGNFPEGGSASPIEGGLTRSNSSQERLSGVIPVGAGRTHDVRVFSLPREGGGDG